jgi:3-deoxy-D-manno-octulosonic-acid transferase
MRFLYTLAAYLLAPLYCAVLLWRGFRERGYWHNFGERLGFGPRVESSRVWLHAASVGEVQAAAALIRRLRERYPSIPLLVTTNTPAGRERVQVLFGGQVESRYLPLDLPGAVRRFFDRVAPELAIFFETELWPNLYLECAHRRVPLILASARISPRSIGRYRRLAGLFRESLSSGIVIAAQTETDAGRFRSIGAESSRVHVAGNINFDLTVSPEVKAHGAQLRDRYAAGRCVWVAGSTHAGEEQAVLEAHRHVRGAHPDAMLILVPRHPQRFVDVAQLLVEEDVTFVKRSQVFTLPRNRGEPRTSAADAQVQVLLVDTLGELLDFYAAADVAFVGGSLVPIGGHNLLEPAALGLPILTGPYNFNSQDIGRLLIDSGAAQIAKDARSLGIKVSALLANAGERERVGALGRAAVEANRGALEGLLALIEPLMRGRA